MRRYLKYSLVVLALLLAVFISPYVFTGKIYYSVNLRPVYHGAPIKPIFPTNEFILGALGVSQSGWQEWAIKLIIKRASDNRSQDILPDLEKIASGPHNCSSDAANYVLFRIRNYPENNLRALMDSVTTDRWTCALNILQTRITEDDSAFAYIIVSWLREEGFYDRNAQIAGRSALHLMGWSFDEIENIGLPPISDYL